METDSHPPATDRATEALGAQGITAPGPVLLQIVRDAIALNEEQLPAGDGRRRFEPADLVADRPELVDRTSSTLQGDDLRNETALLVADVPNKVLRYLEERRLREHPEVTHPVASLGWRRRPVPRRRMSR